MRRRPEQTAVEFVNAWLARIVQQPDLYWRVEHGIDIPRAYLPSRQFPHGTSRLVRIYARQSL